MLAAPWGFAASSPHWELQTRFFEASLSTTRRRMFGWLATDAGAEARRREFTRGLGSSRAAHVLSMLLMEAGVWHGQQSVMRVPPRSMTPCGRHAAWASR